MLQRAVFTREHTHCCGDFRKAAGGMRYQIEYRCNVHYSVVPGRRATWGYDGGTPEEQPEIEIVRVELLEVVLYAAPSYQCGVTLDWREDAWHGFKREAEGWLVEAIRQSGDFEADVLGAMR